MMTFFCLPVLDFSGQRSEFTIATGPVIINMNHDRVLLHKGESTGKWQFLGGRYDDTVTFRENALARASEALPGNTVTLEDEEHPYIMLDTIDLHGYEEKTLLIHYRAHIADETNTSAAQWFSLEEIRMLDAKNETSPENVFMASEHFLK